MIHTTRRVMVATAIMAQLRAQRMTPEDLAQAIGLPADDLAERLNGAVAFDVDELDAIAVALRVEIDALLGTR
ncbi:helix-turn-helix domain-containing protein [Mycetocola miduiensis]|uniref:Cro/C1-type HTH DNA-binding domain-containing protein n=1 Tax=Mycetocola miduiensis TaxID=995034 RepID=A0A1I5AXD0_9MICO|nr:helix-turn-helix transcriptional regulator [Mycetocola miduiensis]SFN67098.1 Cro/C1-type HTH DNA-binding domain-containing protein [Mycetocola miduiensis]